MVTRNYTMRARADDVSTRRSAIVQALIDLAMVKLTIDITLDDVAEQAGVSTRTILRHFGDREGLLDAAIGAGIALIQAEREPAVDDPRESVRKLIDHYELRGDFVLRMLAQEDDPRIRALTANGRLLHREWVTTAFGLWLPNGHAEDVRLTDLLVVATDVYTWKLLRRDRGLARADAESRIRDLVTAVLGADPFLPDGLRR
ncbi:AcrR family transcriptional regulator [Cryobacterium mesophilum]|uniref:TetR/AcrR family transcriptional regulator n=1 Tax=Terrimesophilobacter mesophilus TaxID=433647 RepID=A0A4R8VAG1_9MICO|nr:TetR/AcrR family transcriptional regulator [Terrimesophilobacter mesophilus]MBB5633143.1 AcrR family transcriptional regulator [Terrimesophilobacter mesophilus]TFB79899.1 TetR/AcrR family transcriptional regulator [Terrimesophilobacter mesophilus]